MDARASRGSSAENFREKTLIFDTDEAMALVANPPYRRPDYEIVTWTIGHQCT
jgi:hypothetical protein